VVVGVDAGVVDQAPETAELLAGADRFGGGLGVADVAGHPRRRPLQLGGELLQGVARAGHQHHPAAERADRPGHLRADTPGRAGHDHGAPGEREGVGHDEPV
jgi:hypothetical protein